MPSAQELAGPTGAIVLLLAIVTALGSVIVVLWRDHLKRDQDDRNQRDRAQEALQAALDGNKLNASATADLARAWDERNRVDAARRRAGDRSGRP